MSKITSEDVMAFLTKVADGQKQSTKKLKFSLLRSFFNFIKDSFDLTIANPCNTPLLKKRLKMPRDSHGQLLTGMLSMKLFSRQIIPETGCCSN
nr:hypothetical protein [Desulfobacula sp.]